MTDEEKRNAVRGNCIFAKLTPHQKTEIITLLQEQDNTVGFLGDGINDAAALRQSDIGISVDSAVDIAKESADIILLEKDLMVLEQGVLSGRETFGNIIKYVKMTASSRSATSGDACLKQELRQHVLRTCRLCLPAIPTNALDSSAHPEPAL